MNNMIATEIAARALRVRELQVEYDRTTEAWSAASRLLAEAQRKLDDYLDKVATNKVS